MGRDEVAQPRICSPAVGRNQLVLVAAAFEIAPDEMGKSRAQVGGALPNVILELRDDAEYYSSLRGRIVSTAVGR